MKYLIKQIIIVIVISLSMIPGCSNKQVDQEIAQSKSLEIANLLTEENYTTIYSCFDDKLKEGITEKDFIELIETSLELYGISKPTFEFMRDNPERNSYTANFHTDEGFYPLDLVLTIDAESEVIGFNIQPCDHLIESEFEQKRIDIGDITGFLMVPNQPTYDMVILVGGSGPTDKDSTVGPNKPFFEIAEHLAKNGIATLRFDKRNLAHPETLPINFTVDDEFVNDVIEIFKYYEFDKNIDNLFVLGHSLGAMMIPRIAQSIDADGYIMIASPAIKLQDLFFQQLEYLLPLQIRDKDELAKQIEAAELQADNINNLTKNSDIPASEMFNMPENYWLDLNEYNQVEEACEIKKPILFVQGGMDYQVPKENYDIFVDSCECDCFTFKYYPKMNHIMNNAGIGPNEYNIEASVDQDFLEDLVEFIEETE